MSDENRPKDFANGFDAGVNCAVNVLKERAKLLEELRNNCLSDERRAYYTHQKDILIQMINQLKPTDK